MEAGKVVKIAAGHYAIVGTELEVMTETWELDGLDCDHPMCERFHPQRRVDGYLTCAKPSEVRTQWNIFHRGQRHGQCEGYATRRDAVAAALFIQRNYLGKTEVA